MVKTILSIWAGIAPFVYVFTSTSISINVFMLLFAAHDGRMQEKAKSRIITNGMMLVLFIVSNVFLHHLCPDKEPSQSTAILGKWLLFVGIGMVGMGILCEIGVMARHLIKTKMETQRLQTLKNDGRILLLTANTYKSLNLADPDTYPFTTEREGGLFEYLEKELHIAFLPKERRVMEKHIKKIEKLQRKIERLQAEQEQRLLDQKERREKEQREQRQILQERKETMQRAQEMLKTISEDRKRIDAQNAVIVEQQKELVSSMVEIDQRQKPQGA